MLFVSVLASDQSDAEHVVVTPTIIKQAEGYGLTTPCSSDDSLIVVVSTDVKHAVHYVPNFACQSISIIREGLLLACTRPAVCGLQEHVKISVRKSANAHRSPNA